MKIVVCIKQVPNTNEISIDSETGTLNRKGVPSIINPNDLNALEEALKIKDDGEDVKVTAISMGPSQAETALREALSMGADKAIHLQDRKFAGSDTWATATILASAIEEIGDYDLIFCGREAIDGDTAQVGPEVAEFLGIPQVTYVTELDVEEGKIVATRSFEEGSLVIETETPALITAMEELNEPRFMDMRLIHDAYNKEGKFKVWSAEDIDVDQSQIGIKGSPTRVDDTFVPEKESEGEQISGTPEEVAERVVSEIKAQNLI